MRLPRIIVCSEHEIENQLKDGAIKRVVSITDPGWRPILEEGPLKNVRLPVHPFDFHDMNLPHQCSSLEGACASYSLVSTPGGRDDLTLFGESSLKRLIAIAQAAAKEEEDALLVHCAMGYSRSPACAIVLRGAMLMDRGLSAREAREMGVELGMEITGGKVPMHPLGGILQFAQLHMSPALPIEFFDGAETAITHVRMAWERANPIIQTDGGPIVW